MRKCFIYLLLLLTLTLSAGAQHGSFFRNSYLSLGVGPNYYLGSIGGGAEVTYGKWLLTSAGMRGQFDFALANSESASLQPYYAAHFDLFFDPVTAIRGRNVSDTWRLYFDVGFGLIHSTGDNDFLVSAGIGTDKRIGDDWRLYAELAAMAFPSEFESQPQASLMPKFTVGVTYDIAHNPTRSRSHSETRDFGHDWFFQVAMGVCSFNYRGIGDFSDRLRLLTPIFDFGIGKRFTSLWGARLCLSGLYAKSQEEVFTYYDARGDIMFHPLNWLFSRRGDVLFDFVPYASGSALARLDDQKHFMITVAAGCIFAFHLDSKNELCLDARYLLTPSRFAHITIPQSTLSVGMATLALGYSYYFSRRSF